MTAEKQLFIITHAMQDRVTCTGLIETLCTLWGSYRRDVPIGLVEVKMLDMQLDTLRFLSLEDYRYALFWLCSMGDKIEQIFGRDIADEIHGRASKEDVWTIGMALSYNLADRYRGKVLWDRDAPDDVFIHHRVEDEPLTPDIAEAIKNACRYAISRIHVYIDDKDPGYLIIQNDIGAWVDRESTKKGLGLHRIELTIEGTEARTRVELFRGERSAVIAEDVQQIAQSVGWTRPIWNSVVQADRCTNTFIGPEDRWEYNTARIKEKVIKTWKKVLADNPNTDKAILFSSDPNTGVCIIMSEPHWHHLHSKDA